MTDDRMKQRLDEWSDPPTTGNHDLRNALIFILLYPACLISGVLLAMALHL